VWCHHGKRSLVAIANDLKIMLEEPAEGQAGSGVSNIRGWTIASEGVARVEVFIDGVFEFEVPYGGERKDVENAYPAVTNSLSSGFGQTFNYGVLRAGTHSLTARAVSSSGVIAESSAQFTVVRFPDSFYTEADSPSLPGLSWYRQLGRHLQPVSLRRKRIHNSKSASTLLKNAWPELLRTLAQE
jgi:hypothetical protein